MSLTRFFFCMFLLFFHATSVNAQSCTFTNTGVNFGNVVLLGGTVSSNGTFTATCSGLPSLSIRICPSFNAGSGGASTSGNPRYLAQGISRLNYNLFSNSGRGQVWGSYVWSASPRPPPDISVGLSSLGTGTASQTIFGQIFAGQSAVPTGPYSSTFSGTHTRIDYGYSELFDCGTNLSSRVQSVPFAVSANTIGSCTVATTALDFGNQPNLDTVKTASNLISVTCSAGVLYDVGLSNGTSGGSGPTTRLMANGATPQAITYGIYRDAGYSQPWGDVAGSNTISAIGTGTVQNYTGRGRIPIQATPPSLTYTDTVVVTVTY